MGSVIDVHSVKTLVKAGIYHSEDEVIEDALVHLMQAHPEYRIKLAVYRYEHEEISVGKAAEIAGVSFNRIKEILAEHGIQPRLGARTIKEACDEVETLRRYLFQTRTQQAIDSQLSGL